MASGKFHGEMAREHAASVQPKLVVLAGRPGQRKRPGELAPGFGRVVAAGNRRPRALRAPRRGGSSRLHECRGRRIFAHAASNRSAARSSIFARASPPSASQPTERHARREPCDRRRRPRLERRSDSDPMVMRRTIGLASPFPSAGFAVQLRASSAFSRSSNGSRTSGSLRSTPSLLRRSGPKRSRGRRIVGLRWGSSASSSVDRIGAPARRSDTCSSAMRLTKLEFAPFSSRRRTR